MSINFCTLFDSFYIDKGIAMYNSLVATGCDFRLYILAMNDKCEEVLRALNLERIVVISLSDFLDDELRRVKKERSRGEFCWTCSSCLIKYLLENNKEMDICTYIDADLYFYNSPQILMDEFINSGKSASVIEHRFDNSRYSRELLINSGRFCVQFNSFRNNAEGLKVLTEWRNQCIEGCSADADGKVFGDQKYQDEWPKKYDCVHITTHMGAGIAPWNVTQYKYVADKKVRHPQVKEDIDLIFYHFHMIKYIDDNTVDINVFTRSGHADEKLVYGLYKDYLAKIEEVRKKLTKEYGLSFKVVAAASSNSEKKGSNIKAYLSREFFSKVYMKIHYILNKKKDYISI